MSKFIDGRVHCRVCFFSDFLYKDICSGYSFELHRQVDAIQIGTDAIQIGTHNICLYKDVDKKYTGYNMKTTELPDCAFIVVCAVIRSDTVYLEHMRTVSALSDGSCPLTELLENKLKQKEHCP